MQNQGRGQFNYDVFKAAFDSDPKLQAIVADFDQNSITLKTSETDDLPATDQSAGDSSVKTMAKRAVDLSDL